MRLVLVAPGPEINLKKSSKSMVRRIFFYIAIVAAALLLNGTGQLANAQQGKNGGSNAGGEAASRMKNNGSENNGARWSADPERGWLRSDERKDLHKKQQSKSAKKQTESAKKGNRAQDAGIIRN